MAAEVHIQEERYIFKPELKKKIFIFLFAGILVFGLGLVLALTGGSHDEGAGHGKTEEHASSAETSKMTASLQHETHDEDTAADEHGAAGEHHGSPTWLKKLYTTLWMNNIFFMGLGIIGLFFVAIHYAAQAGWSSGIKRIPLAMASWISIAGVLTLVLWFVVKGDLFHWSHAGLFEKGGAEYDPIIDGKGGFFYWPLAKGTFPLFFIARMVIFFTMWYLF
ncbi:MAG TPA: quinol:cytochrome C oxidoreductase, partial [Cyclobacteriaceae bacterium]|nr:quinol:cytochrome C oxidoreductase [Cyclobacteriaceae bacterium]